MTTSELKSHIFESVLNIDDEKVLAEIYGNILLKFQPEDEPALSDYQIKRIEESLQQIERGEVHSHEDVMKEMEEWLKR